MSTYKRHAHDPEKWIPKAELKDKTYYTGKCRNADCALWLEKENMFVHWRYKFGSTFLESINAPEDDIGFDVFFPLEQVFILTDKDEIPEEKLAIYLERMKNV